MANQRTDTKGGTVKVTLRQEPDRLQPQQGDGRPQPGLRRIRHTVELKDTPATRGMIHKVRHLVTCESDCRGLENHENRQFESNAI